MCGLIGYVGSRRVADVLLDALERLEYRGYDSAGICVWSAGRMAPVRTIETLAALRAQLNGQTELRGPGIGHTRWATHGRVAVENAHPLGGCGGDVVIVLNGIIENFLELRAALERDGHVFGSETDAETVSHLIERYYDGDLVAAVRRTCRDLEGHFAFVAMHRLHPQLLVATRSKCPLVVGLGDGETFVASMTIAFLKHTSRVQFVEDGDIVAVTRHGAAFSTREGMAIARPVVDVDWDDDPVDKRGYESFMLKEIHEQPRAVARTLSTATGRTRAPLEEVGLDHQALEEVRRITIVACGSAYHAGLTGRYALEDWARIPCDVDIASEWRHRTPLTERSTLVVGISQSGETADTLAAVRAARDRGARVVALTNMEGGQLAREVESVLLTRAGPEMGVAATKTFTAQAALLALLAVHLGLARGVLADGDARELLAELDALPAKMAAFLDGGHPIHEIAEAHGRKPFFLYLGRHIGLPIALEGALKLKEIAYVPTEAYSAGEMKHGPIALLDEQTPVICVATSSHVYSKMVSNIQEVRARGAKVIAIASDRDETIHALADHVVAVPHSHPYVEALLASLPLQLLAQHVAELRGANVDRPRNLAKTVTVE